ncbi:MAG: GAF domain-containing protein, partial [bacterium]
MQNNGLTGETGSFPISHGVLSNDDIEAILEKLAHAIDPFIHVDGLSLKISGFVEELLLLRTPEGFKREMVYASRILDEQGFAGRVLAGEGPLVIENIDPASSSYPGYVKREDFKSLVGVPLLYRKRRVGMLSI